MKYFFPLALLFLFINNADAQTSITPRGEFADQSNGLMYADSTMNILRHMVDSLNLRYKHCDLNKTYYSYPQGRVFKIEFTSTGNDLNLICHDIRHGLGFYKLEEKYKKYLHSIDSSKITIKIDQTQDEEEKKIYFLTGDPVEGYEMDDVLNNEGKEIQAGNWTYVYSKKDKYTDYNEVDCRYIPEPLQQKPIPGEYGRYIQYVDCMIDTNARIFAADKIDYSRNMFQTRAAMNAVNNYLNTKTKISRKENDYAYNYLTDEKCKYAVEHLKNDKEFVELVENAAEDCIENNYGSDLLDNLIGNFISKQKALEVKRHRIVIGECSMDQSPRIHARNIAILAAETNCWDIFLRAHLDIMNDRFERKSDGSYAYGGRKTYLKELELLNLDIVDLMFGLSLRAENISANHYLGTVWRLGWALSESIYQDSFEINALRMMKDERLDNFNRGLIFILYHSYLNHINDLNKANTKITELKNDMKSYSPSLAVAINTMKLRNKVTDY